MSTEAVTIPSIVMFRDDDVHKAPTYLTWYVRRAKPLSVGARSDGSTGVPLTRQAGGDPRIRGNGPTIQYCSRYLVGPDSSVFLCVSGKNIDKRKGN